MSGLLTTISRLVIVVSILLAGVMPVSPASSSPAAAAGNTCLKGTIRLPSILESEDATGFMRYESNPISLCFPDGGGDLTGDFSITYLANDYWLQRGINKTLGKEGAALEECVTRIRWTGSFQGTASGGKITGSLARMQSTTEKVSGCASSSYEPKSLDFGAVLTLTLDGRQARGSISFTTGGTAYEMPIEASVTSGGSTLLDATPQSAAVPLNSQKADDPQAALNEELARRGLDWMREGLTSSEIIMGALRNTASRDVAKAADYAKAISDQYQDTIEYGSLLPTENETRSRKALATAAFMTNLEDRDGAPLFPSVRASMRVIAVMSLKGSVSARDTRAVERFVTLLAAMDVEKARKNQVAP